MKLPDSMRQFSLRAIFIIVAWFAVIFAIAGHLVRSDLLSIRMWVHLAFILIGSLIGTVYGAAMRRSEKNRWIRAMVVGSLFGGISFIFLFDPRGVGPISPNWTFLGLFMSTIPAILAASLTEILRMLVGRYAR